jgi:hypothetical protein
MLTISDFTKYLIEGLVVSLAVYLVAGEKNNMNEIILLGLTAAVTFMILDLFTKGMKQRTRHSEGFEGGTDVDVKHPNYHNLPVGIDAYGKVIEYNPKTQGYGQNDQQKTGHMGEVPYRYPNVYQSTCPQKPMPGTTVTTPYGPTRTKSRWMGWIEDGRPVNQNTWDYKIVPGLYSKYIIQPGYNEHIKTENSAKTDNLSPIVWKNPTNNPLDKRYFVLNESFVPEEKKTTV